MHIVFQHSYGPYKCTPTKKRDVTSAMPVPLKDIHLLEKFFCWQSFRGIRNEFDRYRAYVCRTGKNKLLPHMSAMLVPLKEVHSSTTKVFLLAIFQRYMVQNVPDLGHIPILHTVQKHCNVFLDRIMPDIGHISKCVRSLF